MASIFITGAGGGIGSVLVAQALARGDMVIAGVFSEAEQAGLTPHANLHTVLVDVGSTDSVAAAFRQLDAILNGLPLNAVVNCAAICPVGAVEVRPVSDMEATLNINVAGSVRVLREALPRLRGHNGRILLFSSLWGKVAGPMLSCYCASKHAIEAVADATRREIRGQDVSIVVIEPGVIRAGMAPAQVGLAHAAADNLEDAHKPVYGELYRKYAAMIDRTAGGGTSVEDCAAQIGRILAKPKPKTRYAVGTDSKAITFLARILPDSALDGMFKAMLK